ncbi:hypothetical protein [Collinsella sp. AF38-3AC]|uniref:hypothetical protein n=1 Tax=Collinsella sp. AF38-3AC TaxID=2292015 RepID=UPI000E486DE6|nr:hypothetical protein [Collinsella sp. AF38-3AC]RHL25410.1 hypothetical protein DW029_02965 [Collinsella sp. AF38-3AC]
MDFGFNDPARKRLEQEPYWKQYGWMSKLGLNGPREIVFALIFERDCTDDPARDRITSKYISRALDEGCPARRGSGECGIARVFKVLNELASKGLVCAVMDEDGLSMSFKCDYDAVESILAGADSGTEDDKSCDGSSESEVEDGAYDKMS